MRQFVIAAAATLKRKLQIKALLKHTTEEPNLHPVIGNSGSMPITKIQCIADSVHRLAIDSKCSHLLLTGNFRHLLLVQVQLADRISGLDLELALILQTWNTCRRQVVYKPSVHALQEISFQVLPQKVKCAPILTAAQSKLTAELNWRA
jgi:hypothetical protein